MFVTEEQVCQETKTIKLNGEWQFRKAGEASWGEATVPGCNFTDLFNNCEIEDPFYRTNENKLQWIEHCNWEYKKVFTVASNDLSASEAILNFEGLDTYCDVFLNNKLVLESKNMFVGAKVNCLELLIEGRNELLIKFRSPIAEVMPKHLDKGFTYPAENDKSEERLSVYTRKAPYHYGWDWGPRFVTSGIWRNVSLDFAWKAQISDVYVQQYALTDDEAQLIFDIELTCFESFSGQLTIECDIVPNVTKFVAVSASSGKKKFSVPVTIKEPKLWWPNGLGEAHLYDFRVTLDSKGARLSKTSQKIGLRTIEVINEEDDMGESFYVKVNGYPIFMKGANYIPSDSFLNRVSTEKYKQIFEDAVSANMNMLRVWGGGIYENDEFYEIADEYGILIWQDFMFACSLYPADEDFLKNVKDEVVYNVKRLRNHACLALWCGNNETEMGIEFWNWPTTFGYSDSTYTKLKQEYDLLFKSYLPSLLKDLDSSRFYFSSSPIGFWENKQDDSKGDNHYWGVWHGEEPFTEFKNRIPRFMSEFGFQSFPLIETVKKYCDSEDLDIDSEVMKLHQKHPRGNSLIKSYMEDEYHTPKDFESFLYMSQVQQSLGMKIAFESHRSAMPFCMGSLYWQFNDCWPVASWSGIDYYGNWKAMHYQVKRSFEPVAVFLDEREEELRVNLVSDILKPTRVKLAITLKNISGESLWSNTEEVDILPSSSRYIELDKQELLTGIDCCDVVLEAQLISLDSDNLISRALHYFVATKKLNLKKPIYTVEHKLEEETLVISLKSNTLARQVYVFSKILKGNFSDNFFDLLAGEEKVISIPVKQLSRAELSNVSEQLEIMSIVDSYL